MAKLKNAFNAYGPFALPIAVAAMICFGSIPQFIERRIFMSGCLTAAGYSDEAQRRCYQHFLQYETVKNRDWKPAGDPG